MKIEERLPISACIKALSPEIDGEAWILVSTASLATLIDAFAGTEIVRIREKTDLGKALTLQDEAFANNWWGMDA